MSVWRRLRLKVAIAAVILFVIFQIIYFQPQLTDPIRDHPYIQQITGSKIPRLRELQLFFDNLEDYAINATSIKAKYKESAAYEKFASDDKFPFDKQYLENVLDIDEETFTKMKDSHTRYVEEFMPQLFKDGVATFGKNIPSDGDWDLYHKSRGYVLVGGGKYSWLSYLVIRQLRALGATHPIELFIPSSDDYEAQFCEEWLPKFNARCNLFDDTLSAELKQRFNLGGYQYKTLALLSSRFESVLYLDSDNFPVRNPDYLFDTPQYTSTGLVLWPDAWARTTNPKFYDIASAPVKETKVRYSNFDKAEAKRKDQQLRPLDEFKFAGSRFHDFEGALPDPTSETGQLLVDKTRHVKTLLLALYYNVFGPNFYYPIMTQGSAGEGDKESFIAAAHVLGQPYFQTQKVFKWVGYVRADKDNSFDSKALGHYDPEDSIKDPNDDAKLVFMHLSYPKYYPDWLVNNHELISKTTGNHERMYESIAKNIGYDFDLRVLQLFTMGACKQYYTDNGKPVDGTSNINDTDYMGHYLGYIRDNESLQKWCKDVFVPHLSWLKETTEYKDSVKVGY